MLVICVDNASNCDASELPKHIPTFHGTLVACCQPYRKSTDNYKVKKALTSFISFFFKPNVAMVTNSNCSTTHYNSAGSYDDDAPAGGRCCRHGNCCRTRRSVLWMKARLPMMKQRQHCEQAIEMAKEIGLDNTSRGSIRTVSQGILQEKFENSSTPRLSPIQDRIGHLLDVFQRSQRSNGGWLNSSARFSRRLQVLSLFLLLIPLIHGMRIAAIAGPLLFQSTIGMSHVFFSTISYCATGNLSAAVPAIPAIWRIPRAGRITLL
jgi:hypothetical protein